MFQSLITRDDDTSDEEEEDDEDAPDVIGADELEPKNIPSKNR